MDKLEEILLDNKYVKNNNIYQKHRSSYISVITVKLHDSVHVKFSIKRLYKNENTMYITSGKSKICNFVNSFNDMVKNEHLKSLNNEEIKHCEIYCMRCEGKIDDYITVERFSNIDGFIHIHSTQYGKCIVVIDDISAKPVIEHLNNIKFCSECIIPIR